MHCCELFVIIMSRRGNYCASEQELPTRATLGGGTAGGAALIRSPVNDS